MSEETYNLIMKHLPILDLDIEKGIILNRKGNSLSNGYLQLGLEKKKVFQHQIFAVARWGKKCIGMTVNHINEIRTDNSWNNLELLTSVENLLARSSGQGEKPIKAKHLDTGEEFIFESQHEASRQLGVNVGSIQHILNGKRKHSKRYTFERISA